MSYTLFNLRSRRALTRISQRDTFRRTMETHLFAAGRMTTGARGAA